MDETRMPGSTGAGEVHTRIGVGPEPSKGMGMSGKFDMPDPMDNPSSGGGQGGGAMDSTRQRAGEMMDQARDTMDDLRGRAGDMAGQAREQMDNLTSARAGDMANQARARARSVMDQAGSRLEDSGAIRMVRENPMVAVGIAFGIGFLLAGSTETKGRMGKAKNQIKGAIMGGISAAISQELRELVGGSGGLGSMLGMEQQQGGGNRGSRQGQQQGGGW